MQTKIFLWSADETLALKTQVTLTEFTRQAEAYFNQFGHLPPIGSTIKQDEGSADSSVVIYVNGCEYSGIEGDQFVIGIDVTTKQPKRS